MFFIRCRYCYYSIIRWKSLHRYPSCIVTHHASLPTMHCNPSCIVTHRALLPIMHRYPPCIVTHHALLPVMHCYPSCIVTLHALLPIMHCYPSCIVTHRLILQGITSFLSSCPARSPLRIGSPTNHRRSLPPSCTAIKTRHRCRTRSHRKPQGHRTARYSRLM